MHIPAIAAILLVSATVATAQDSLPWSYQGKTGPLVWDHLDPAYHACGHGHQQSPVDLRGAHLDTGLAPIRFHFVAGEVTVVNDGRGITVRMDPGSSIEVGGVRYNLIDFTFHHPSEHAIHGQLADMEVDFLAHSAGGKMAQFAVLFNVAMGYPNATVAALWEHLPTKAGATERITDMIDPGGLFPQDTGYWTYTGSLLVPPCTEDVAWYVFETPLTVSREQIRAFTSLFKMNTRPLEDLHGRRIEASE
ncbi:MAG TPA: carbonic anhydrase family protein [Terracidiphilus sp.]|nr:carbonic anhydrase family protein [Terracidiphilus sp.]